MLTCKNKLWVTDIMTFSLWGPNSVTFTVSCTFSSSSQQIQTEEQHFSTGGTYDTCLKKTVILALKINLFVPSVPGHQLVQHVMILFMYSLFVLSKQIEQTVDNYHSHHVCSVLMSSDHQLMCQSFV